MSKLNIIGMESSEGISNKSGKPYAIGNLHTIARLADSFQADGVAKGHMGTTYSTSPAVIAKIKHLQTPFMAEVQIEAIMKFGKREESIVDVVPLAAVKM